jgi:hypothetical protein
MQPNYYSDVSKVAEVLRNFSDYRKKPGKRRGGKTWPGLQHFEQADVDRIAIRLLSTSWSGRKATKSLMEMADAIESLLCKTNLSWNQKWQMGRVLLSALTYSGLYRLERDEEKSKHEPYYIVETGEGLHLNYSTPERTRFQPFPRWTRAIDDEGNRLVRPSRPCPTEYEHYPEIPEISGRLPWLDAVHQIESVGFRISTEFLDVVIEAEKNDETRVIRKLEQYPELAKQKKALNRVHNRDDIPRLKKGYRKDKKIREADEKRDKKRHKEGKNKLPRSKGYVLTEPEQQKLAEWKRKSRILWRKMNKIEARRRTFDRELEWAKYLSDKGTFYQRVSVDYRGRIYLPEFSYQGSDFARAVIEFSDGTEVSREGWLDLLRHSANVFGMSAFPQEKIEFARSNVKPYIDIAQDPIGHFDAWYEADKPFGFLRSCIEIRDNAIPMMKHLFDNGEPSQLKSMSKQTTIAGAKKWFRSVLSRYDSLELREDELWPPTLSKSELLHRHFPVPDDKYFVGHMPCEVDQSNSAFQHIGLMMGDKNLQRQSNMYGDEYRDLYIDIADAINIEGAEIQETRKIIKKVAVPWSYGASNRTCGDALRDHRDENPDKAPYLNTLDDDDVSALAVRVVGRLRTRFPSCVAYSDRVKRSVDRIRDAGHEVVRWNTPFGFLIHQRVHRTRPVQGIVYGGDKAKGDVELRAKFPLDDIDWARTGTKTPPNLVHSYDSALLHGTLWAGRFDVLKQPNGRTLVMGNSTWNDPFFADTTAPKHPLETYSEFKFPVVTIHDAFSCPPSHCSEMIGTLQTNLYTIYAEFDPFHRFLNAVENDELPIREREFEWKGSRTIFD